MKVQWSVQNIVMLIIGIGEDSIINKYYNIWIVVTILISITIYG